MINTREELLIALAEAAEFPAEDNATWEVATSGASLDVRQSGRVRRREQAQ